MLRRIVVAFTLAILALPALSMTALGHERRTVGKYTFEVGWLNEPALAGMLNGVDLTVTDDTDNSKPVEGLQSMLKVKVFYGGLTRALALDFRAIENDPGHYAADLIPTKDGTYTFHIFGTIGTLKVDERFESGPNRFDDVDKPSALQYPDAVPNGADLNSMFARLQSAIDQARVIAIVAVALAILIPAGMMLTTRRGTR